MKVTIPKSELERLYVSEKKSTQQIAVLFGTYQNRVTNLLREYGISARAFSTKGLQTRLGAVLSEETKEKIRKGHLGKKLTKKHRAKISKWMRENTPTLGKSPTEEQKEKQRQKMKGRKLTPEHRAKVIKTLEKSWKNPLRGDKHPHWKGGISGINARLRQSKSVNAWKKAVKERDDYTCVLCGHCSKSNHADHIKPFALFPELRTSIENGRTLCVTCHRKTETYGGKVRKKV